MAPPKKKPVVAGVMPVRRWIHFNRALRSGTSVENWSCNNLFDQAKATNFYGRVFVHQVMIYTQRSATASTEEHWLKVQPRCALGPDETTTTSDLYAEGEEAQSCARLGWKCTSNSAYSGPWYRSEISTRTWFSISTNAASVDVFAEVSFV
jgi:hypothetical protein